MNRFHFVIDKAKINKKLEKMFLRKLSQNTWWKLITIVQ